MLRKHCILDFRDFVFNKKRSSNGGSECKDAVKPQQRENNEIKIQKENHGVNTITETCTVYILQYIFSIIVKLKVHFTNIIVILVYINMSILSF